MTSDLPFATSADPGWPLSPLDGRYRRSAFPLAEYLSEAAVNRWRVHVEVEWLIFIADRRLIPDVASLTEDEKGYLRGLVSDFSPARQARLAELEDETRHDVKAVEYLVREHLADHRPHDGAPALRRLEEAVHLLCTSEDINNLAIALGVRAAITHVWLPAAASLIGRLTDMARDLSDVPMLARTHGQSATPTTVGKELAVFAWRLQRQFRRIATADYRGKLNGATGTYSAHVVALPHVDWFATSQEFVESLGLEWNPVTTQIESHDWQGELYGDIAHFNRIAHNVATDMWTYISLGYFRQDVSAHGSTGSSTMPHKVNPIRFENAEANLELSSALLDLLSQSLTTSRLQRDLSDSSLQRNIGVALGYSLVALDNLTRGLAGLTADATVLATELDRHWEVLGEAIQQMIRVARVQEASDAEAAPQTNPYDLLKDATRGRAVSRDDLVRVIESAHLSADDARRLDALTPASYTGLAAQIVDFLAADTQRLGGSLNVD